MMEPQWLKSSPSAPCGSPGKPGGQMPCTNSRAYPSSLLHLHWLPGTCLHPGQLAATKPQADFRSLLSAQRPGPCLSGGLGLGCSCQAFVWQVLRSPSLPQPS
jgi:hypothetical protein